MKRPIPPHIGWPLLVVGLLSLSVIASLVTVFAARSGGGAQVVDDYYEKAVAWDATKARRAASAALGWRAEVTIRPAQASGLLHAVEITVRDRDGVPVEQLTGTLRAFRPERVEAVAEASLVAAPGRPGVYRQPIPITHPGLWDFEVVALRDSLRFETIIRKEITR